MSFLRASTSPFATLRVAANPARRTLMTSAARRTDDPKVLNSDTHSGASVKADKHAKGPETLQKETASHANTSSRDLNGSKVTGPPNPVPTHSEDTVHGEKHSKSVDELQKETTQKLHS